MDDEKQAAGTKLQWHPAFYAGLQIEFEKEAEELIFQNEYQLGTKPREVDVLIKKKDNNYQVKKNIGKFFRKYNLIEYKSPHDYLNIDDYYKVCSYAGFFKADTGKVDEIKSEEVTISFVVFHQPRKLMKQLREKGFQIRKAEKGIYYIKGGMFPAQIIVTKLISKEENFWLRNLTNKLESKEEVYRQYQKHSDNNLYKSVMDIIVKANGELFKEGNEMCQALFDLYRNELMEMVEEKAIELAEVKAVELAEVKAVELAEAKAVELAEERFLARELEKQKRNIINLMNNAHFTLEKAMDVLMIPDQEYPNLNKIQTFTSNLLY